MANPKFQDCVYRTYSYTYIHTYNKLVMIKWSSEIQYIGFNKLTYK